jgi:hypothetical protein
MWKSRPSRIYGPGLHLLHGPGGVPVRKGEASWRTVCGVMLCTPWGHGWWCWR